MLSKKKNSTIIRNTNFEGMLPKENYRFITLSSFHTPKFVNINRKVNRAALTMQILSYPKPNGTTA